MPYPLPPSWAGTNPGLRWFLVAIPDEPAFVQAALGAYTELGNYWQWGKEGPTELSNEAALLFREASAETLRAWEMSLLDTLVESIDEVEDLLRLLQTNATYNVACCDYITPLPPTPPTIPTTPPTTWGEDTPVPDEDTWTDLKCGAAHAYVDYLIQAAEGIEDLIAIGGVTMSAIAGMLALLSGAGILAVVAFEVAAGAVSAVLGYTGGMTFGIAASDLETYRDDIVCAIIGGDPAELRMVLDSILGINYDLFYRWIDFETALAVIATGNYKDANLDPAPRTDCECEPVYDGFTLVPWTITGWSTPNGGAVSDVGGVPTYSVDFTGNADKIAIASVSAKPANTVGVYIVADISSMPVGGTPNSKISGIVGCPPLTTVGVRQCVNTIGGIDGLLKASIEAQLTHTDTATVVNSTNPTQTFGIDYNSASGLYVLGLPGLYWIVETV